MISIKNEKKKRISKKNKSSWRKHVDVRDVEEFLEEQRLEERLGEPLSELKNEELFTVDGNFNKNKLTAKEEKRLRLAAPPKCFSMLQPHTKVPDPITKRNHLRTREERMCPILKRKENERKLKGILKFRERQSITDRKKHEMKLKEKKSDGFTKDIWNNQDKLDQDEWVDKSTKRHMLRGIGKLDKINSRVKLDKNAAIPNVEIPHPGTSYNPSFKDHTDLLMEIAEKETKIIKEEEHIKRVTKDMFKKVSAGVTNDIWLKEMSQGLPEEGHSSGEDEISTADENPYKSVNPPVENKRKTMKQRRKLKYEEPDVVFSMKEDLTGNLRNLKVKGSLLSDRFTSLQKRNLLAVTARHNRRKSKVRKFVKPGFKDDWKKTIAGTNIVPARK
ncbi:hypothetical protein Trydic_g6491 [Trypoxylus dichotomus]